MPFPHDLLPYLTPKKLWNYLSRNISYFLSFYMKAKVAHWGQPFYITIEPTTACNLRCPQCPSGLRQFTRETGNLAFPTLEKILSEMADFLISIQFYFQGEPLIHPRLPEFIRMVHTMKIHTVLSTNAHFLDDEKARMLVESGLDELIISLDGMSAETYSAYRKEGDIQKVFQGIKYIMEKKKQFRSARPKVTLQFLVFRHNEQEVGLFLDYARKSGADRWTLKGPQVYDLKDADRWIPSDPKYARYEKKNGEWKIRNSFKNRCYRMWTGCVITWDGYVVPCCFDKDAKYKMGNIREQSWEEIRSSPAYRSFVQMLLNSRKEIDICRNCTEGTNGVYS